MLPAWVPRMSTGWCPTRRTAGSSTRPARSSESPREKTIVTVDRHANTSSASIPLALNAGIDDGRITPGDLLVIEAIGGGLVWGAGVIRL